MNLVSTLSDPALIAQVKDAAAHERRSTAQLIELLAELDARRLYLAEGCASLFVYCTRILHLSEHAAYGRITAARASRRFPKILEFLGEGAFTLTTVVLLAPHVTEENADALLPEARHRNKADVERLVAGLQRQPDIQSSVRKVPAVRSPAPETRVEPGLVPRPVTLSARPVLAPISSDRYLLRVTLTDEGHARLRRAQDLLRHVVPTGDPAAIVERALEVLVEQLQKIKIGQTLRPRKLGAQNVTSRHVPSAVKRAVWQRDEGRCAFVGREGRCHETGFLEFHHVEPYSEGGRTTIENLSLRCRAHNAHEYALGLDRVEVR